MLSLICAAFLSLPLYPLNPTTQDTVSTMNLHVTVGVNSRSAMISESPNLTLKYEYLIHHPFIMRTSLEFSSGEINSKNYPNGTVQRYNVSTEVLYYKGTRSTMAYLGLGLLYGRGNFELNDNLYFNSQFVDTPNEIDFGEAFGYRFLMGLRLNHTYSLEVTITEISPSFIYRRDLGINRFTREQIDFRGNSVRVSLGYLFRLM